MGLNNDGAGNGEKIVVVKHGGLCLESKTEREGYDMIMVPNPSKDGEKQPKWIKKFTNLDGMITDLEWFDTEDKYEARFIGLKVHMQDGDETFALDLPYDKRAFDTFTKIVENIDFSKPVTFTAWQEKDTGRMAFGAKQGGEYIRHRYTKDNLGDCPPAKYHKHSKKWDFSEQRDWLLAHLLDEVIPGLQDQLAKNRTGQPIAKAATATGSDDRWDDEKSAFHDDE